MAHNDHSSIQYARNSATEMLYNANRSAAADNRNAIVKWKNLQFSFGGRKKLHWFRRDQHTDDTATALWTITADAFKENGCTRQQAEELATELFLRAYPDEGFAGRVIMKSDKFHEIADSALDQISQRQQQQQQQQPVQEVRLVSAESDQAQVAQVQQHQFDAVSDARSDAASDAVLDDEGVSVVSESAKQHAIVSLLGGQTGGGQIPVGEPDDHHGRFNSEQFYDDNLAGKLDGDDTQTGRGVRHKESIDGPQSTRRDSLEALYDEPVHKETDKGPSFVKIDLGRNVSQLVKKNSSSSQKDLSPKGNENVIESNISYYKINVDPQDKLESAHGKLPIAMNDDGDHSLQPKAYYDPSVGRSFREKAKAVRQAKGGMQGGVVEKTTKPKSNKV